MIAPTCKKIPLEITQHGQTRTDNYAWLRDENWKEIVSGNIEFKNKDILDYIEKENAYKDYVMQKHKPLEKKLYGEILSRIREDKESYPLREGGYYYFEREKKGENYSYLCRFKHNDRFNNLPANYDFSAEKKTADVYFDLNKEAHGNKLYSFRDSDTNKSNTHFAYMYNLSGSLECSLKVRDLSSGEDLPWKIENTTGSFQWVNEDEIYYAERDEFSRGKKVYKINIHEGPDSKKLVFTKPDEFNGTYLGIGESTDEKYMFITLSSGSTQVTYISQRGTDKFEHFITGTDDVIYSVEHFEGNFYILTNEDAEDFKIMKCPAEKSGWDRSNWMPFLDERPGRCLNEIHVYSNYMAVECKNNEIGLPEIEVLNLKEEKQKPQTIKMPENAYTLSFWGSWDFNSENVKIHFNTPISPSQIYELNLSTKSLTLLHTEPCPNFDSNKYVLKREFAKASDGNEIPVTIIHLKSLKLDGSNPAFVYGYGSYGSGMPAYFSSTRFSLIDRGFVYCIAHIRGGDEKGNSWYLDGKMDTKKNTFTDFIDSCDHLIQGGYTSKGKIAANGGSAGGLLMGAVTNMRPDLFKAVIADVAFVDVVNTISDETLPLTPPEWEEWGNPIESKDDFEYILSYSPYENIEKKDYPSMLYNSGISDEQVTYWEPTKMVAKLRELKTDNNNLLLNMKMHAGHAGASKKYEWIEEIAFNFTFVLSEFGLD